MLHHISLKTSMHISILNALSMKGAVCRFHCEPGNLERKTLWLSPVLWPRSIMGISVFISVFEYQKTWTFASWAPLIQWLGDSLERSGWTALESDGRIGTHNHRFYGWYTMKTKFLPATTNCLQQVLQFKVVYFGSGLSLMI